MIDGAEQYFEDIRLYLMLLSLLAILGTIAVASLLAVIAVQLWKVPGTWTRRASGHRRRTRHVSTTRLAVAWQKGTWGTLFHEPPHPR